MEAELRFHLERDVEERVRRGQSPRSGRGGSPPRARAARPGEGGRPRGARRLGGRDASSRTCATACASCAGTPASRPRWWRRSRSASARPPPSSAWRTASCCGRSPTRTASGSSSCTSAPRASARRTFPSRSRRSPTTASRSRTLDGRRRAPHHGRSSCSATRRPSACRRPSCPRTSSTCSGCGHSSAAPSARTTRRTAPRPSSCSATATG